MNVNIFLTFVMLRHKLRLNNKLICRARDILTPPRLFLIDSVARCFVFGFMRMTMKPSNIILLPLIIALALSCTVPNEPAAPDWTVRMNDLPLLRADTLFVAREIKSDNIVSGADSVTTLLQTGNASFSLDNILTIDSLFSTVAIINPGANGAANGQLNLITPEVIVNGGDIGSGTLAVTYSNKASVGATITVEIRGLTNSNAYFAQVATNVLPNQEITISTNLSGWQLQSAGGLLAVETRAFGTFNPANTTERIEISLKMRNLQFETIEADVSTSLQFPGVSVAGFSEMPGTLTGMSFTESSLRITVEDMPFSINPLQLTLRSTKNGVQQSIPANINAPAQATTVLTFNKNGVNNNGASTTLVNLVDVFPEMFSIAGNMNILGLDINLEYGAMYSIPYEFSVPFDFTAPNGLIENIKTLSINSDVRDVLNDNLVEAELGGEIVNATPFSGTVVFAVGTDTAHVTHILIDDVLLPATLDGSGKVSAPVTYSLTANLDLEKIKLLTEANFYKFSVGLEVNHGVVRNLDHIILRDVYISGLGKISL